MTNEQLSQLRNELYEAIPTGEMNAWDLLQIIKAHIKKLDAALQTDVPKCPTSSAPIDPKRRQWG